MRDREERKVVSHPALSVDERRVALPSAVCQSGGDDDLRSPGCCVAAVIAWPWAAVIRRPSGWPVAAEARRPGASLPPVTVGCRGQCHPLVC